MLLQEQAINAVLVSSGQFLTSLSAFRLTPELVSSGIFIPAVLEYQRYRPVLKTRDFNIIGATEFTLPDDFIQLASITPSWYSASFPMGAPSLITSPLHADQYEIRGGKLIGPPGLYRMDYFGAAFTFSRNWVSVVQPLIAVDEHVYEQEIPTTIQKKSLRVKFGDEVATADHAGKLTGTFLTSGLIDYRTNLLSLVGLVDLGDFVLIDFKSVVPGVVELSLADEMFLDLFGWKLLMALGMAKAQLQLEGIPTNINADDLKSVAEQKGASFRERLATDQKWWMGVPY